MNEELKAELERMIATDQAMRKELWTAVQTHGRISPEYEEVQRRGEEVDRRAAERLTSILEEHGWPGVSLVGEAACRGAFLILQHADLATQLRYLPLLEKATEAGEIGRTALPLLVDRIRMRQGQPQLYGSQFTFGTDEKPALWPIEDEAHLDERRAGAGLEPHAAYLRRAGMGHLRPQ